MRAGEQQLGCTVIVGARRGRHHQSPEYPGYIFQINYIPRMAGADAGPDTAVLASHFLSALPTHDDTCIFQVLELRRIADTAKLPQFSIYQYDSEQKPSQESRDFIFCQFSFIRCMQDNTASTLFQIKIVSLRCMLECISNSAEENQAAQHNRTKVLFCLFYPTARIWICQGARSYQKGWCASSAASEDTWTVDTLGGFWGPQVRTQVVCEEGSRVSGLAEAGAVTSWLTYLLPSLSTTARGLQFRHQSLSIYKVTIANKLITLDACPKRSSMIL